MFFLLLLFLFFFLFLVLSSSIVGPLFDPVAFPLVAMVVPWAFRIFQGFNILKLYLLGRRWVEGPWAG